MIISYYDADPVDGPATSPVTPVAPTFTFPARPAERDSGHDSFTTTASFIHPCDSDDDSDSDRPKPPPEQRQPVSPFDFDSLPPRFHGPTAHIRVPSKPRNVLIIEPEAAPLPTSRFSPKALLERIQMRCNITQWLVVMGGNQAPGAENIDLRAHAASEKAPSKTSLESSPYPHLHHIRIPEKEPSSDLTIRKQFKLVKAVPAFASPLTRVLSPVIVRGQWEIVVRSTVIAFFVCWIVLGSLLAVPVPRSR